MFCFVLNISFCRGEAPVNDDASSSSSDSSGDGDSVAGSDDGKKKKQQKAGAGNDDDDEDPVLECAMPDCKAISTVAIATRLIAFCFGCGH